MKLALALSLLVMTGCVVTYTSHEPRPRPERKPEAQPEKPAASPVPEGYKPPDFPAPESMIPYPAAPAEDGKEGVRYPNYTYGVYAPYYLGVPYYYGHRTHYHPYHIGISHYPWGFHGKHPHKKKK